jgi:hypothetical protein
MWPLVRYHACNVLDSGDSIWNSGKFAPASICIKLTNGPQYVTSIKLQTEMSPVRALVHHEIYAGLAVGDGMQVIGCIKGPVCQGAWIHVAVNQEAQFLEIKTISSLSFVAWKRIRVYGKKISDKVCHYED